jgi:Uri superfamily endonuclease
MAMAGAAAPVKGFGSSDCRCRSHLAYFEGLPPGLPVEALEGQKV